MTNLSHPMFHDEDAAREYLEALRWPDGPVCPYCGQVDTARPVGGKSMGAGWYYCPDCERKFTVRVGTVYERSHIPLHKWVMAMHLMAASKKGISAHQLHRMLGVTYKSAWFMAHRIREAMADNSPAPLGDGGKSVEADETYYGVSDKGHKRRKRFPHLARKKQGGKYKMKIVSLVERGGPIRSFKVEKINAATVQDILFQNVTRKADLLTDEAGYYKEAGREYASHQSVNHSLQEYARGFGIHINTLEGYYSIFKRGMKGVYQHCAEKHLHRYLAEFDFRFIQRIALGVNDDERAARAIMGAEGKRLTYRRARERANKQAQGVA